MRINIGMVFDCPSSKTRPDSLADNFGHLIYISYGQPRLNRGCHKKPVIITYHDLQIVEPLYKEERSMPEYRNFAIDGAFRVILGGKFGLGTGPGNDGDGVY